MSICLFAHLFHDCSMIKYYNNHHACMSVPPFLCYRSDPITAFCSFFLLIGLGRGRESYLQSRCIPGPWRDPWLACSPSSSRQH